MVLVSPTEICRFGQSVAKSRKAVLVARAQHFTKIFVYFLKMYCFIYFIHLTILEHNLYATM